MSKASRGRKSMSNSLVESLEPRLLLSVWPSAPLETAPDVVQKSTLYVNQNGDATITPFFSYSGETDGFDTFFNTTGPCVFQTTGDLDTMLAYYHASGQPAATDDNSGQAPANARIDATVTAGQHVELALRAPGADRGSYALLVNGPASTPTVLTFAGDTASAGGDISSQWDYDFYQFTTTAAGNWGAWIHSTSSVHPTLMVFDSDGNPVDGGTFTSANGMATPDGLDAVWTGAGLDAGKTYFLRVDGDGATTGSYDIAVRELGWPNAPLGYSPLVSSAHDLYTNQNGWATITGLVTAGNGMVDYVNCSFDDFANGTITAQTTGPSDTQMAYYVGAGGPTSTSDDGGLGENARIQVAAVAGRQVTFAVQGAASAPYAFVIQGPAPTLAGTVAMVAGVGTASGNMQGLGDSDFFALPIDYSGTWTLSVTQTSGNSVPTMILFDDTGTPLVGSFTSPRSGQPFSNLVSWTGALEGGHTYYLRVDGGFFADTGTYRIDASRAKAWPDGSELTGATRIYVDQNGDGNTTAAPGQTAFCTWFADSGHTTFGAFGSSPAIAFYGSGGPPTDIGQNPGQGLAQVSTTATAGQVYPFAVKGSGLSVWVDGPAASSITDIPMTLRDGSVVALDGTQSGVLDSGGTYDFLKFVIPQGGLYDGDYRVTVIPTSGLDVSFNAYDEQDTPKAGTFTQPVDEGGNGQAESSIVRVVGNVSHVIYVRVDPQHGTGSYQVQVRRTHLVVPTVSINDVTVNEQPFSSTQAVFTLTLSEAPDDVVAVSYQTANGTAIAGDAPGQGDYDTTSGWVSFAAGQTSQQITIPVNGDIQVEGNEDFYVELQGPESLDIADGEGVGTIADAGADPRPTFSIDDVTVTEGDPSGPPVSAVFTVSLSKVWDHTVTVNWQTHNDNATSGDYTADSGTITMAAGDTSAQISISITPDMVYELTQGFHITLSGANGALIADDTGAATILDNDPMPTVSVSDVTVNEGLSGTTSAVFIVSLTGATEVPAVVNYGTSTGTADSSDFAAALGTVTFAPGETTKQVAVTVYGDATIETAEQFTLNLQNPTDAQIGDGVGVATILNGMGLPTVSIQDATVTESNAAGTTSFTVTLSRASDAPVTVHYATSDVTAIAAGNADYTAASGTLTFAAGQTSKVITVTIAGDRVSEDTETFNLILTSPAGAILDSQHAQAVGTILDDDTMVTVQALPGAAAETTPPQAPANGTFRISRSGITTSELPVTFAMSGTAKFGASNDYTLRALPDGDVDLLRTVTIPVGADHVDVALLPVDDSLPELAETATLTLARNAAYIIADQTSAATVTILDNEPRLSIASTGFAGADATAAETTASFQANTAFFRITRTGSSANPLTVSFKRSGTATMGAPKGDYTLAANGTSAAGMFVTIPAGDAYVDLIVTPYDDAAPEGDEFVTLKLAASKTYSLAPDKVDQAASVQIVDNEPTVSIAATGFNDADGVAAESFLGQQPDTAFFRISRTGSTASGLTVNFKHSGTAALGAPKGDYTLAGNGINAARTSVVIPPGAQYVDVTLTPYDDTVVEHNELVTLTLSAAKTYSLAADKDSRHASAAIYDNDATKLTLSSNSFAAGGTIPLVNFSLLLGGANKSFPLSWASAPGATQQFALVVEDQGDHNSTRWLVAGISAATTSLAQDISVNLPQGMVQGLNAQGVAAYEGPGPSQGTVHSYRIRLYALDTQLNLTSGFTKTALTSAISKHILAWTDLIGAY